MPVVDEVRRRVRQIAPQVLLACLAAYFGYHAIQGDRGIIAWQRLKQELAQAREINRQMTAERAALEHRVHLLRPDNLDPDMLEERARLVLNFGHADDYVVFWPEDLK